MSPWKILGIARTADTREIKRAYAKKLKTTKPDEKPAEFQTLHQAYKSALQLASRQQANSQTATTHAGEELAVENDSISEDVLDDAAEPDPIQMALAEKNRQEAERQQALIQLDIEREQAYRISEYEKLIAQVDALLKEKPIPKDLSDWSFLANSPYLLEDDFNWNLGRKIFQLFAEYSQIRVNRARGRSYMQYVPSDIVVFCDQLFSWKIRSYYLQAEFGEALCANLFSQIESSDEHFYLNQPNQGLRGGTFIRGNNTQKKPTDEPSSGSFIENINFFQVLFLIMVLVNLARCVANNAGR